VTNDTIDAEMFCFNHTFDTFCGKRNMIIDNSIVILTHQSNFFFSFLDTLGDHFCAISTTAYETIRQQADFQNELATLMADYVGRPSPVFHARRLSQQLGGAQIHLKREDLNHTGAHKINHCLGEALLAKFMGKTRVIAETGAGQHGVALATACALVGIPCEIHMGQVDIEKEHPNVTKMRILGCRLVAGTRGAAAFGARPMAKRERPNIV